MIEATETLQEQTRARRLRMAGADAGSVPAEELIDDAAYIQAALTEFRDLGHGPGAFRQRATLAPDRALTAGERRALAAVGMMPDASTRADAERARREALYVFFHVFQTALSTAAAAALLQVNPSRVRQRVAERTLLVLNNAGELRFPAAQFHGQAEVPGLRQVLPALPHDLKPLEALSWLTTPTDELPGSDGMPQSPREYLLSTGDADTVAALAQTLKRGEAA